MSSTTLEQKDLLLAWTRQCFEAAGLETSEKEIRTYAAVAASEIINEGLAGFAEGNSVPHGSGSNTVAGGHPVPGFIAYLNRSAPQDDESRLDAFDEIFQHFIELTATVEAAGESEPLSNAAYNRSANAAGEILQQYFELRSKDFTQQLHKSFGDASTPAIDMSKVTVGKAMAGGGCALAVLAATAGLIAVAALAT